MPRVEGLEQRELLTGYTSPYAVMGLSPSVVSAIGTLTGAGGRLNTTEITTTTAPASWYDLSQYDQPNDPETQGTTWGPQPLLQPTAPLPAGIASGSFLATDFYIQNVLATAYALVSANADAQFAGTAYQHHHNALWNPYANGFSSDPRQANYWPWSPVTINNVSNADIPEAQSGGQYVLRYPTFLNPYVSLYGQGTAGIDCSDTTALSYNAGAGIFIDSSVGQQGVVNEQPNNVNTYAGTAPVGWYNAATAGGQAVFIPTDKATNPNITPIPLQFFIGPNSQTGTQGSTSYNYISVFNQPGSLDGIIGQLQPGDLLYITGNPGSSSGVTHVVIWLGQYGTLADGSPSPVPLVISSHDNTPAVLDASGNMPPTGVHVLPFTPDTWFYQNFSHAMRLLPTLPELTAAASSNQPVVGTQVTLTATITIPGQGSATTPTGTVTFLAGSTVLGTTSTFTQGSQANTFVATISTSALSANQMVTVEYAGDANYPANSTNLFFYGGPDPNSITTSTVGPFILSTPGTVVAYNTAVSFPINATDRLNRNGTAAPALPALTVQLSGAPSWLSLGTGNVLTGTPPLIAAGQTYAFTITAHDGIGPDAVQNFVLTTQSQAAAAFTSSTSAGFTEGIAGSFTVSGTGFPSLNFSVDSTTALPSGLSFVDLGQGTGVLYGTPASGTSTNSPYSITLDAEAAGVWPSLTQALTVIVAPPAPAVQLLAVGTQAGTAASVNVYNAVTGAKTQTLTPFPSFTGGVRVAVGAVAGPGTDDIVCGAGPGGGPHVAVYSGATGALLFSFFAFAQTFTGGVNVAVGDVNADGYADIICGADAGGGPDVKVFSGKDQSLLLSLFAYDQAFTGGVSVAAADMNGDGYDDVISGAGKGGGPHVKVFSGNGGSLLTSFFPYDVKFTGGVSVGGGQVNGRGQLVTGAGAGGGPDVGVYQLAADGTVSRLWSFFPYDSKFQGGVLVSLLGTGATNTAGYVTVPGPGGGPDLKQYNAATGKFESNIVAESAGYTGGLFVAADPG